MSDSQEGATALHVGRYGLFGAIIGALIGGLGSFSGAYLTYRQQYDTHAVDTKRAAYVNFLSEAEQYRQALGSLVGAADQKQKAAYAQARKNLFTASAELFAAVSTVYIVGDMDVVKEAVAIRDAFFYNTAIPPLLENFDMDAARNAIDKGTKAMIGFEAAARTDVLRD